MFAPRQPNLASPAFKANPFPFYAWLREESPVARVLLPNRKPAWLITRYTDVAAALKDERLVKDPENARLPGEPSRRPWIPKMMEPLARNMLDVDPPEHERLRRQVHRGFTPRLVEGLRGRVQALADEMLDRAAPRGGMDLIHDYAVPIPTTIIAEILGVPVEDRRRFHRWSSRVVQATASGWAMARAFPNVLAFMRYIRALVRERSETPRDDLLSGLAAGANDDGLSADEVLSMAFLLLIAGHETTVNLIGNGMLALLEHPDQLENLRADPELIGPAVEEMLRYAGPLETATERYAREDLEIAGTTIPRGEVVYAALASANRDEAQFPAADTLELARAPNRHLAFGLGIHFCLGAPLARLEAQIAIATLLRRAPHLQLKRPPAELRWRPGLVLRGLRSLPVTIR